MNDRPWSPSRPAAVLIGLLSLWPILYFLFFLGFIGYTFTLNTAGKDNAFPSMFRYVIGVHLLTMVLMFVLLAIYIVHAFRTDRIPEQKKVLWLIVLFFGNMLAFPVYWYLFMWRRRELDASTFAPRQ